MHTWGSVSFWRTFSRDLRTREERVCWSMASWSSWMVPRTRILTVLSSDFSNASIKRGKIFCLKTAYSSFLKSPGISVSASSCSLGTPHSNDFWISGIKYVLNSLALTNFRNRSACLSNRYRLCAGSSFC